MKKKLMFSLLALFAVTIVSAGYLVNSFMITTDVYEPFNVEYAILGNAGNYVEGNCGDAGVEYTSMDETATVDVGGLYAGESRKICTKIANAGEGDVAYTFTADVISGNNNLVECEAAFGSVEETGIAVGLNDTFDGAVINVAGDAVPVEDCQVTIAVTRG